MSNMADAFDSSFHGFDDVAGIAECQRYFGDPALLDIDSDDHDLLPFDDHILSALVQCDLSFPQVSHESGFVAHETAQGSVWEKECAEESSQVKKSPAGKHPADDWLTVRGPQLKKKRKLTQPEACLIVHVFRKILESSAEARVQVTHNVVGRRQRTVTEQAAEATAHLTGVGRNRVLSLAMRFATNRLDSFRDMRGVSSTPRRVLKENDLDMINAAVMRRAAQGQSTSCYDILDILRAGGAAPLGARSLRQYLPLAGVTWDQSRKTYVAGPRASPASTCGQSGETGG